jgi:DNA-binding MarR family transcriptional regulator
MRPVINQVYILFTWPTKHHIVDFVNYMDYLGIMKAHHIKEIRSFNRFYTNIIGLLDKHVLNSAYSLPEVRIMYELYHQPDLTASHIIGMIDIDKGYLSRVLRSFEKNGLMGKLPSPTDGRSVTLYLTTKGRKEFETLNTAADKHIMDSFRNLSEKNCNDLIRKMNEIRQIIINR